MNALRRKPTKFGGISGLCNYRCRLAQKVSLRPLNPGFSRVAKFLGKNWIYPSKRHLGPLSDTDSGEMVTQSPFCHMVCISLYTPMIE